MFKFPELLLLAALFATSYATVAEPLANVGRAATPAELAAWDIDVRPDFKGLPAGSGSVLHGQQIWDKTCATCHGSFGESNHVFSPLVGGTTADDIKTGHVAALTSNSQPERTTLMTVATLSTLWDYIHRAMPWTAPKSLSVDDVYAVTAYILNLGEIVPDNFVLSNTNIADVQKLMPNRNGMTFDAGLWKVSGHPDTHNIACMNDCATEVKVTSSYPKSALGVDGDLSAQNRTFGEVRGIDTKDPASTDGPGNAAPEKIAAATVNAGQDLVNKYGCAACHGIDNTIVGPGFRQVAEKYKSSPGAAALLMAKIKAGGSGAWGSMVMPPQSQVSDADLKIIVDWVLKGAN